MDISLNRRQWLKTSALATAGIAAGISLPACRRETPLPYLDAEGAAGLFLHLNENPYGLSANAAKALAEAASRAHRYPHKSYDGLKKMIAARENVSPDQIILGAGSTEVMTMLIHSYGIQGEVIAADPTYFDFVDYAEKARCTLVKVPLNDRFEHDLQAMEQRINSKTSLIYICNPHNPTATIVPKDLLRSFSEETSRRALVAVDEAYHDYAEDPAYGSMMDLARKGLNVVVTRTFSKIHGLAGLRIGYGISHPDIIKNMEKAQTNFASISYPSIRAAIASYQDFEFCRSSREKNKAVKSYLCRQLERLGYFYLRSHANFVLFRVDRDPEAMAKDFEGRQILVRPFVFMDSRWIRVSLGTMDETKTFVAALDDISRRRRATFS